MAKISSVIKFTGNLDGMVGMKGANGETYLRKNVKPADPKTTAQTEVRLKMSLAGQISKLTPAAAIMGLGGSKRERRNRFMKLIMKNAEVTTSGAGEIYGASLPPQALIFSEGQALTIPVIISNATGTARGLTVKISQDTKTMLDSNNVKAVMVIFVWSENDTYKFIDVKSIDTATLTGAGTTSLNLSEKANVYVIPLIPNGENNNPYYLDGVERMENEGYSVAVELVNQGYAALGQSVYSATGTVGD